MPRVARIKSSSGIYHIIERGINQQNIFSSDDDYMMINVWISPKEERPFLIKLSEN